MNPKALVTTFEPPGESIGTLYDNFEFAAARSPHVRCLVLFFCSLRIHDSTARPHIDQVHLFGEEQHHHSSRSNQIQ